MSYLFILNNIIFNINLRKRILCKNYNIKLAMNNFKDNHFFFSPLPLFISSLGVTIKNKLILNFYVNPMCKKKDSMKKDKTFSSMALKPINIRWIRTSSVPYWKLCMLSYYIQFSSIIKLYNHKTKTSFSFYCPRKAV